MDELEKRIQRIEERNVGVENDKAWETSFTRKLLIMAFTYLAVGLFFSFIGITNAWINALVPVLAFFVSTFTMPFFKRAWLRSQGKKI